MLMSWQRPLPRSAADLEDRNARVSVNSSFSRCGSAEKNECPYCAKSTNICLFGSDTWNVTIHKGSFEKNDIQEQEIISAK